MKIHIVQRGDTLWSIAEKHQVSFEEVKKLNAHLANPDMIVPGMKIKLPDTASAMEKGHPYADQKPFAYPPKMEEVKEMEEMPQPEFQMPENWMTEPVPAPKEMEEDMMMMPCPPMPCYFFPMPYPMPYMMPMMPDMMQEAEEMEEAKQPPHMMLRCPYCHR